MLEKIIYTMAIMTACVAFGCVLGNNSGKQSGLEQGIEFAENCASSGGVVMYVRGADYWCQYE